jgi:hypothetical protein
MAQRKKVEPIWNWKDPTRYQRALRMPSTHLAWEFLRRNRDYQAEWKLAVSGALGGLLARVGFQDRWGIALIDPHHDDPWDQLVSLVVWQTAKRIAKMPLVHLEPNQLPILFDVSLPLEPQLRGALPLLKAFRTLVRAPRRRPRLARQNFLLYLRLLDARAGSASYAEIAAVLEIKDRYDSRAKVGELLRQAREWTRPERYLLIASSPPLGFSRPPE